MNLCIFKLKCSRLWNPQRKFAVDESTIAAAEATFTPEIARAKNSFEATLREKLASSPRKKFRFKILPTVGVAPHLHEKIIDFVRKSGDYRSYFTEQEERDVEKFLEEEKAPLEVKHVKHMKSEYQNWIGIKRHKYLIENSEAIAQDYFRCKDILQVCETHDLPPHNLFRHAIFPHLGLSQPDIKWIFKSLQKSMPCPLHSRGSCPLGERCPLPHDEPHNEDGPREWAERLVEKFNALTEDDCFQLRISELYDNDSSLDHVKKRNLANAFEDRIESAFATHGVRYFTGRELKSLGGTDGVNLLTPDLMLLDDVEINGVEVKWIDAKNQFGNPSNFLFTLKLKKQWNKYQHALGQGAFIFNGGCMQGMIRKFPPTTILTDAGLRELESLPPRK